LSAGDLDLRASRATALWSLRDLIPIADTPTSRVLRAKTATGPVALKLLKPYGADEIRGAALLDWYGGRGAVRLLARSEDMMLLDWCPGAALGDLVRSGEDARATEVLCEVIAALHARRGAPPPGLAPLAGQVRALLETDLAGWPPEVATAAALARHLLATETTAIPLHGDLHHDNVIGAGDDWRAIDPKGLTGDPAYEVANAFRNPLGAEALAGDPARIGRLADRFAARLGLDRQRMLEWGTVQAALSAVWDRSAGLSTATDLWLLPRLLAASGR
jgi:streptomycin 6-kinase